MGLLSRIRRLTVSRIESFLNTVEDPEVLFPQLVREMEDQVRAATGAEAKALAAVKAAERAAADAREKLDQVSRGAELALGKGEEETAREAVAAQIGLEVDLKGREGAAVKAQSIYEDARAAREQIQKQLEELRRKKEEILTRARVARSQHKIERTVSGPTRSTGSILDAVARLESKVESDEAELTVRRGLGSAGAEEPSLERKLDTLAKESEIEQRMAALKAKLGKKPKA